MRRLAAGLTLTLVALSVGCSARRSPSITDADPEASVAVYRGHVRRGTESERSFRLRVFATRPDRIHAEISGPVGGPRLILDGGDGRVAFSVIPDRTAYVGDDDREALKRATGLDVGLEELVTAFLEGRPPASVERFERTPATGFGWPARLLVVSADVRLDLRLKRTHALPSEPDADLGTGRPAPGLRVLPLSELSRADGDLLVGRDEPGP